MWSGLGASRLCFGGCSFVAVGSGTSRACQACTSWEELQPVEESSQPLCGSKMSILSSEDHYSRDPVQVQSSMPLRHWSSALALGSAWTNVKSARKPRLGQDVCVVCCVLSALCASRLCFGGCSFVVVGSGTSRACQACTSWEELQPVKESSQPLCGSKMSILSSEDHYSRDPVQVQSSMPQRTATTAI
jgi:hypothetical protein